LRERGHLESWGTLDSVHASFQQGFGQGIPTLQMLDKIQALKVGMHINTHFLLLFEAMLQYLLEGSMPE
jgi:hypothetical protein